jgi:GSCFA family
MDFHLEMNPAPIAVKMELRDRIFLIGSCFTEHISSRLLQYKFRVFENPHGILFNPSSICSSLLDCINRKTYTKEDLFDDQGIWSSWDFHSRFSHTEPGKALESMNTSAARAYEALKSSKWMMITLGSAFVYQLANGRVVANCHKSPASRFTKKLLGPEEVMSGLDNIIHQLRVFNPGIQVLLTVSPVRHLREGLVENNRSKAVLIHCVHQLVSKFSDIHYFPAYELVIDDLRDYRFYAEDMVHPNYQATRYVWEKFTEACISPSGRQAIKEIQALCVSMAHKPLHPGSPAHEAFLQKQKIIAEDLSERYPYLDFSEEIRYFSRE